MYTISTPLTRLAAMGALDLARSISAKHGVDVDAVLARGRSSSVVRARHETWVLVMHTFALSLHETARLFNVDHSSVCAAERKYMARGAMELARAAKAIDERKEARSMT